MGVKDILPFPRTPEERKRRIEQERPHQQRAGQDQTRSFVAGCQRQEGEGESAEDAAHVAHKDPRRRPIVDDESHASGRHEQGQPEDLRHVAVDLREQHPSNTGDDGLGSRNAVDAVHEVVNVHQAHDPEKDDDVAEIPQVDVAHHRHCHEVPTAVTENQEKGRHRLDG